MYGLGSFFGTTCCCGNSREETKGNEITVGKKSTINRQEKQNHSKFAQDDPLSNLPNEVRVDVLMPFLDIESLAHFSQTSKNDAIVSANTQLQRLNEELNELITNSGITGIQNPEGPFKNSMHQLRVLNDFKDAIRVLRGNGITDINATDEDGNTPLHLAAINGHTETVRALINAKADVNLANNDGSTPLHRSAIHGHTEAAQALLAAGADVDLANDFGNTPLHLAERFGHTATAQALIELGADVNLANNFGATPLHEAARHGHTENVQALIKLGADVNLANNDGSTPLNRSARHGHTETVQALLAAGADVNLANNFGATPLHEAARHGHTEIIEILRTAQSTQGCLPPSCSIM